MTSEPSSALSAGLARMADHPGVEHVVIFGSDGLVVEQTGGNDSNGEIIAATAPAIRAAGSSLGGELKKGEAGTIVMELGDGVVIVQPISTDLLLAVLLRPGFPFGELLVDIRSNGRQLTELI